MIKHTKLLKNSLKSYIILGIIFLLIGLFIAIIGHWTLSVNNQSLKRVYSFRLFSRGNFQVIAANLRAMTSLSQAIYEKDDEKLEDGYLHLESAYGFLVSVDSELYLQGTESSFGDKLGTYDNLLEQYELILKDPYSKRSYQKSLVLQKEISSLNQFLGFAESQFWAQRAKDFESIRIRNKNMERIYWTLVLSFVIGTIILIYFFIERFKLEGILEK